LDPRFEASGRTGANLSRINRDIRFAKDKIALSAADVFEIQRAVPRGRRNRPALRGIPRKTVTQASAFIPVERKDLRFRRLRLLVWRQSAMAHAQNGPEPPATKLCTARTKGNGTNIPAGQPRENWKKLQA